MRQCTPLRLGLVAALVGVAMLAGEAASSVGTKTAAFDLAACHDSVAIARVKDGAKAEEPELYAKNQANAYGVLEDRPTLPSGSVGVSTVFHLISDHENTPPRRPAGKG
jgi:hypothetical protein